jgi:hypothetical protein
MLSLFSRKVRKTRLLWQFVNDDCVPQLPDATETLVSRAGRLSIDRKLFASIKFRAKFEKRPSNSSRSALDGAKMSGLFKTGAAKASPGSRD